MESILGRLKAERDATESFEKWLFSQLTSSGLQFDALVQRTPGWDKARHGKITASKFGVVAELSVFADARALWQVIVGEVTADDLEDNEHIKRGIREEPRAIQAYERVTGNEVRSSGFYTYHEPYTFLGATPDGLLTDNLGLIEVKCPAKDLGSTWISKEYMAQVQGQLEICNRAYCDFCIWHPLQGLRILRVHKCEAYW